MLFKPIASTPIGFITQGVASQTQAAYITATGELVIGNLTEQGRFVSSSGLTEIGEYTTLPGSTPSTSYNFTLSGGVVVGGSLNPNISGDAFITGTVELSMDGTSWFSNYKNLELTQESDVSFDGLFIEGVYGSVLLKADTTTLFGGTVGGSLNLNLSGDTFTKFTGVTGSVGDLKVTAHSNITLGLNSAAVGSITSSFDTVTLFENTIKEITLAVSGNTVIEFVGYQSDVAGSITLDAKSTLEFLGVFTPLNEFINTCLAVNTSTFGVSEYTNYNFNSFFNIGKRYFGCSSQGIFELTGNLDHEDAIQTSVVRSGVSDFGTDKLKSIKDCYVYIRNAGDNTIRLIANEQVDRDGYPINYDFVDGLHRRRVKTALGIRASSWQVEFKNVNGQDFTLQNIEVVPKELSRTV